MQIAAYASVPHRLWFAGLLACLILASGGAGAQPADTVQLVITAPQTGQTIHDNNGEVAVAVTLQNTVLAGGRRLRPLIDGRQAGADQTALSFTLRDIERGEHVLVVQLLDANGSVITASPQLTFHMWRASTQFPSRKPVAGPK